MMHGVVWKADGCGVSRMVTLRVTPDMHLVLFIS